MVAEKILGNIKDKATDKAIVNVDFEWFELEKKRIRKVAGDGEELGVCVEQPLREGDILGETESAIYVVRLVPAHLIKISVSMMEEMGRLGFELGNRHLSLQITPWEVKVPYDEPTFLYLKKLGFQATEVTEQFHDFIQCKAHGEAHHHEHSHS